MTLTTSVNPLSGLKVTCPPSANLSQDGTSTSTCTFTSSTAGTYTVTVTGTDSNGSPSHTTSVTVTVVGATLAPSQPSSYIFGLEPIVFYGALGVAILAIIGVVGLVFRKRALGGLIRNQTVISSRF